MLTSSRMPVPHLDMKEVEKKYRMILAAGVFLTALALTAILVMDKRPWLIAGVCVTMPMVFYGSWGLWMLKDNRKDGNGEEAEWNADLVVSSLASALAASYARRVEGLSDGERVFLTGYVTQLILLTVDVNLTFNSWVMRNVIGRGCVTNLQEIQSRSSKTAGLLWEGEMFPVEKLVQDNEKVMRLDGWMDEIAKTLK